MNYSRIIKINEYNPLVDYLLNGLFTRGGYTYLVEITKLVPEEISTPFTMRHSYQTLKLQQCRNLPIDSTIYLN